MPTGNELWLGVSDEAARLALNSVFGTSFSKKEWPGCVRFSGELLYDMFRPLNSKLNACYPEALRALGLTIMGTSHDGDTVVGTPNGRRDMDGWSIGLQYDPIEVGSPPVFGVALTGRYFPTLLDWRSEYGTLEDATDLRAVLKEADLVLPILHRELPFTKGWPILLVEIFY